MQAQAFDKYANTYDVHFTHGLIGAEQRKQVYYQSSKIINNLVKTILEINCGTGEDALWLAEKGYNVLATDISQGMLNVAQEKNTLANLKFKHLQTQHISSLQPSKYDLIFSNFGGLNCLDKNEFTQFRNDCCNLQATSNKLLFVIMGTSCLWERLYYWIKKETKISLRRKNKLGEETTIDGVFFKTYYYSPKEIKDLFKENYKLVTVKPIGFFVPPSYLEGFIKNKKRIFKLLTFLDKRVGNFSLLSNYADHYLICLEKK